MLAVVTPVYNPFEIAKKSIDSVVLNTSIPFKHILVYNNPPYDHNLFQAYFKLLPNNVSVIDDGKNMGCHQAVNYGWKEALIDPDIQFLAKIDDDTIVPSNWASRMITAFNQEPSLAILATECTAKHDVKTSTKSYANGIVLEFPKPPFPIVGFSAMMISRRTFENFGPLHSDSILYGGEEHYYCEIARKKGKKYAMLKGVLSEHQGVEGREDYMIWKFWYGYRGHRGLDFEQFLDAPVERAKATEDWKKFNGKYF